HVVYVRISVKVINSRGVKCAGTSNYSVHFVAFPKQQIRQITSILAGNAGDQCLFHVSRLALEHSVCTIKSLQDPCVKRHRKNSTERRSTWPANSEIISSPP